MVKDLDEDTRNTARLESISVLKIGTKFMRRNLDVANGLSNVTIGELLKVM